MPRLALLLPFILGLLLPAALALDITSASQYNAAMQDSEWVNAAEAETVMAPPQFAIAPRNS